MRLRFSDTERLKKTAKANVDNGIAGLKKWWSKKYKLPPNHKLFLNQSVGELNLEMFEDWYLRRNELEMLLTEKDYGYNADQIRSMQREVDELSRALGEKEIVGDDLIDKWEKEIEAGISPDLSEGLRRD